MNTLPTIFNPSHVAFGFNTNHQEFEKIQNETPRNSYHNWNNRKILGYVPLVGTIMGIYHIVIGKKLLESADVNKRSLGKLLITRGAFELVPVLSLVLLPFDLWVSFKSSSETKEKGFYKVNQQTHFYSSDSDSKSDQMRISHDSKDKENSQVTLTPENKNVLSPSVPSSLPHHPDADLHLTLFNAGFQSPFNTGFQLVRETSPNSKTDNKEQTQSPLNDQEKQQTEKIKWENFFRMNAADFLADSEFAYHRLNDYSLKLADGFNNQFITEQVTPFKDTNETSEENSRFAPLQPQEETQKPQVQKLEDSSPKRELDYIAEEIDEMPIGKYYELLQKYIEKNFPIKSI